MSNGCGPLTTYRLPAVAPVKRLKSPASTASDPLPLFPCRSAGRRNGGKLDVAVSAPQGVQAGTRLAAADVVAVVHGSPHRARQALLPGPGSVTPRSSSP